MNSLLPAHATVRHGICWMILSTACISCGNAVIPKVASDLHPFQIGFLTNAAIFLLVWPALRLPAPPQHRTRRIRLYVIAAAFGGFSNLSWFYGLAHVPLAEATAISFAAPIIVTACAGLLFGEQVHPLGWAAIFAGFLGVLLIVKPGFAVVDGGTIAVLLATVGMSGLYILSKQIMGVDSTRRAAAMMTLSPMLVGFLPAVWVWGLPSVATLVWIALIAGLMYTGRVTMLLAFRAAPASTVMQFDFARLPFSAAIAYFAFGEIPDAVAMAGAGLIIASCLVVGYRGGARPAALDP